MRVNVTRGGRGEGYQSVDGNKDAFSGSMEQLKSGSLIVRSVNRCDIRLSGIISGMVLPEFANFARGWRRRYIPRENLISRFNRPEIRRITGGGGRD